MTIDEIKTSQLSVEIVNRYEEVIQTHYVREDKGIRKVIQPKIKDLPTYSQYVIRISKLVFSIIDNCKQLEYIPIFLSKYEPKEYLESNKINHAEYLHYHTQNHLIKVCTLFDQQILLLNEIYDLGILENHCNIKTIGESRKIKNTETYKILNEFNNKTQDYRNQRNLIVHRGIFKDDTISHLSSLYLLKESKGDTLATFAIEWLGNDIVDEKTEEIKKNREMVFTYVKEIFNSLTQIFIEKLNELKLIHNSKVK
jgi:hypothetical protein